MARISNIQVRRDTAANWTSTNPTLANGEIGFETDTKGMKIGDGSTTWTNLGYEAQPFVTGFGTTGQWWYLNTGTSINSAYSLNQQMMWPIYLPKSVSIQAVAAQVVTGVASSTIRLGLYAHDVTTGRPKLNTNPLFDWGTVATTTSATTVSITGLSSTLPAGWSWLTVCPQGAVATMAAQNHVSFPGVYNSGSTSTSATVLGAGNFGYVVTGITGAFASFASVSTSTGTFPLKVAFKTT